MTKNNMAMLERIFKIVLSAMLIICGFLLIKECLWIYQSSEKDPYTIEKVATAFGRIQVPIYICLFLIVTGLIAIGTKKKPTIPKNYEHALARMYKNKDLELCEDSDLIDAIKREQWIRKFNRLASYGFLALAIIITVLYAMLGDGFGEPDITTWLIQAMKAFAPLLLLTFAFGVYVVYSNRSSMKRELELYASVPKRSESDGVEEASCKNIVNYIGYPILIVGIILMIVGANLGGTADVLTKAINICTECIGLG